jgi:addiction module HigA family antidote
MARRDSRQHKITDPAEQRVEALPPLDRPPGVFIREVLLPEYGLDISKLARHIQVNRANLHEVLSGKRDVSRDLAYRLGAAMGDETADLLLAYQHAWDLAQERDRRAGFKETIARLEPRF